MPSEPNVLGDYLTRSQLAAQLGKSERTIERWGLLQIGPPITWLGREPRYKITSVQEWLQSREERVSRRRAVRENAGAAA